MNKQIWELRIKCCDAIKKCEVDSDYELEDLCYFILESFDFDNDHPHQFYLSRSDRPYSRDMLEINSSKKLNDVFPKQDKRSLFLLFDFGDEWVFNISKTAKKLDFIANKKYPIVTEEKGDNPKQYPDYED